MWITQIVFYGLPWLQWNGRQALLFDLAARKFYIFGMVMWPQDIIYLTAILIIAALSLFLFTAVGGRLWCGYACPQTVYTEIFMWIERQIEGDRAQAHEARQGADVGAQVRAEGGQARCVDRGGALDRLHLRRLLHADPRTVVEVATFAAGGWSLFWILFYGFATYGNAGWMREQVCKYMCPYARFQSAMFDPDTLIVTYDRERGEPRGAGSKKSTRPSRASATASRASCACRSARPASTSATDCSTSASAAPTCIDACDLRDGARSACRKD